MQLQTVNRSTAETLYGNFTNGAGATITTGYAVALTTTVASLDGNLAVLPAASQQRTFLGIAASDVPNNAVGRYICYGYAASVFYMAEATSVSVITPDHCAGVGVAGSNGVGYLGITTVLHPVVILTSLGAIVRSAGGYIQGFVRAM